MNAPSPQYVLRRLPVNNKATVLVDDQDLNHIISAIKKYHKLHQPEFDSISEEYWQGNAKDTARVLFDFLKKHVPYDPEPESDQTIKRPGRFIQDAYNGTCKKNDCKHYASFICGIVDSLDRKGYPIHCNYRFVSDVPGKDVHHVFAVVRGNDGEFWVDPVLRSFDQRPPFHNTKDISFSHGIGRLTYLSGSDYDEMGKIDLKKIWQDVKKTVKKVEHGAQVNLQNISKGAQQTVKKVQHGMQVNQQNTAKGLQQAGKKILHSAQVNLQNAGKGIKQAAKEVAHVALKVVSPVARNAVLALLDINAFNLARRFTDSLKGPKGPGLQAAWKKYGGDPAKLAQAARNGLLFQAKLHHKDPKSVHGFGYCMGMGATYHSDMITTHPHRWIQDYWIPRHRRNLHKMRNPDGSYNMALISGTMVGLEPVSTASLMALAAGLLAVLAQFLKTNHAEQAAMADEAKQGTGIIAEQAAAADLQQGYYKADQMTTITQPPIGTDASMSINTGIDELGQPEVVVQDVRHPALMDAGGPDGGAGGEVAPADKTSFITDIEEKAKNAWRDHKGLIIGVGVVFLLSRNKAIMKKLGFK